MYEGGLSIWDYVVVVGSLILTMGIGLYFSKTGKKSMEHYVFGGRKMAILPVTLSMSATLLSTSSIISGQEVYLYGTQFMASFFTLVPSVIIAICFYLPVLYSLQSVSPYEYFGRRYNNHVKTFMSTLNVIDSLQSSAMYLYTPSLTFAQASGLPLVPIVCFTSLMSMVYTVVGGLTSVAWADSFQMVIMVICSTLFFILGIAKSGGWSEIVRKNDEGYRWEFFNMNSPLTERTSFLTVWSVMVLWLPHYLSPSQNQRLHALPSQRHAKKVLLISFFLLISFMVPTCSLGFIAFAYYAGCDPVLAGKGIASHSTIITYFINDISKSVPGLTGLFYSSLIAAGLSTTTSIWNTAACTTFEDLIKPMLKKRQLTEKESFRIITALVFAFSVISTIAIYFIQSLGSLLDTTLILKSATQGAIVVLFSVGMFFPWINSKGAIAGGLSSVTCVVWCIMNIMQARRAGLLKDIPRFLTTENCLDNATSNVSHEDLFPVRLVRGEDWLQKNGDECWRRTWSNATIGKNYSMNDCAKMIFNFSSTLSMGGRGYVPTSYADDSVFWLFKLPLFQMAPLGAIVGTVVSLLVSGLTGWQNLDTLDPDMIVPQMRRFLPKKKTSPDVCFDENHYRETGQVLSDCQINDKPNAIEETGLLLVFEKKE